MNDIAQLDAAPAAQSTALTVIPASALPTILKADGAADILSDLAKKVARFKPDISTEKGREEIKSMRHHIRRQKVALDNIGKDLTETWRKSTTAVNAERNVLKERMVELEERVYAPLAAYEQAEAARIAAHEAALAQISEWPNIPGDWTAEQIGERIAALDADPLLAREWHEFRDRAGEAVAASVAALKRIHAETVKREAEAVELARLRAEAADRERQAELQRQAEREAEIARQAAEQAKAEAEARAAEEAAEAERKAAAERERIEAQARAAAEAAEAERLRVIREAEEEKAAAERRAEEHRLAAERERAEAARRERDAQERADRLEREAKEAADRAEAARIAAQQKAEREKAEAIEDERLRVAQEANRVAEETRKREADKSHRAQINREAALDLQQRILLPDGHSLPKELAQAIIVAVAKSEIRHVSIKY